MKVVLVCIAKNEDYYIEEWIDYHKKIGVDNIFIYQNDWRFDKNIDGVYKIEFHGQTKQVEAYNHFIQNYHNIYDWGLFIDVDEFIVLKKHKNIKELISDYAEYNGIAINWYLFGDNNLNFVEGDYSVVKRFTKREKNVNQHIKTLLKLNSGIKMNVHSPNVLIVDSNYNIVNGPFNIGGPTDVVQINHYFVKTKDEFIKKINRGRADSTLIRNENEFHYSNCNEIEDLTAYNFIIKNEDE
jgi:hypothetical protein